MLPDTILYLNERAADETNWLQALSVSGVNTSLVWGLHADVVRLTASGEQTSMGTVGDWPGGAVLVDQTP